MAVTTNSNVGAFVPYKFYVYRNAAQNTGNGAFAVVNCDTKSFDTGSNVDIVTNIGRFTAPVAGFYWFAGQIDANVAVDNGLLYCAIFKNGSRALSGDGVRAGGATTECASVVSGMLQLAASDFVELFSFSSSAVAMNVGVTHQNYFQGFLISAT